VTRIIPFILLLFLLIPSVSCGEDLYQRQLNRGIRDSEAYSLLLIEQARTAGAQKMNLLRKAMEYSPDLPAVYFELSKESFSFTPDGVFQTIDYMLQGIAAYQRNFWWLFMLVASLFLSGVISFFVAVSLVVVVRLPRDVPLFSHDVKEDRTSALLLLVLLFAVLGPLYLPAALLMIIGLYMKRWDRLIIYLYLLFLLISPWIFKSVSTVFDAPASGELKAVVQVNESKGNRYALSVLQGRENAVDLFSYALALKREGGYGEAIKIYDRLIGIKPDARLYNNLANCYVGLNDIEKAKGLYLKSIEQKPLPVALYNLSEVYRETLDFEKGEEYFLAARKIDGNAVSRFRAVFGRNPNRFVIDEGLSISDLWEYARSKTAGNSTLGLSVLPPTFTPGVAVLLAVLFFAISRQARTTAYRCNRCGSILCNRCEKHILWGHMCLQCYRSLVKLDELDAKERIARILAVYGHQKKRRDIIKSISFIVPGGGRIYAGNVLTGFVFLWPFLFFILIPVMHSFFVMEMSGFSGFWINAGALFCAAVVYLISVMTTKRRLARGWL
jgi:tetratricopeptide (TPR) repeat protein